MRWETVFWFTITAASASAVHLDNGFFVTNAIEGGLNLDTMNEAPTTTTATIVAASTESTTVATTAVAVDATTTRTPGDTTTELTTANTLTYNTETYEKTTAAPQETTEGTTTEKQKTTTLSVTTDPIVIQPDQVGRSSEAVGEPGMAESAEQEYLVLTTRGPVQGFPWGGNPDIIGYIDVPYGSFEKPFQDPTPPSKWENIRLVREHDKRCPQMQGEEYVGDLDCLTLSIFTPSEAVNSSVLVHVHESNFTRGSGDPAIYGPEHFVTRGIILVLPNYRLGPLGFLCLSNATAPGNAALKDLTLALKWVKENIVLFGGDPSNVVVSGEGTSGALAGYLALSPESNSYVDKVITESGSVLSHWALNRNLETTANTLVKRIREISTSNNTIEAADLETIVRAAVNISFSPCIEHNDHPFLSKTPWSMLHNGHMNITFMIGTASHAGSLEAVDVNDGAIELMNNNFGQFLPSDLRFDDHNSRAYVGNQVRNQYFGNGSISSGHVEEMSLWFTDASYLGPAVRTARALLQAGAEVFFYEFAFVGELNRELDALNRPLNRTARGDIVGYLFSQDGTMPDEGTDEKRMVDLMVDMWVSFIVNGTPAADNVTWAQLDTTVVADEQWLFIGEDVEMRKGLHVNRLQLWSAIYEDYFIEHNLAHRELANMFFVLPFVFWTGFWKPML